MKLVFVHLLLTFAIVSYAGPLKRRSNTVQHNQTFTALPIAPQLDLVAPSPKPMDHTAIESVAPTHTNGRTEAETLMKIIESPADGTLSLEEFALPQINQCGTATCAYNAATGMMEILYAMKYQKKVNFSEPYFLACAPPSEIGAEWFVNLYNKYDTKNKGVVGNEHFPSTIYQQYNHPTSALQYAQACEAGLQGVKTSLGFKLKAKPLFFHADWDGTSLRVNKTASSEEMNLLISWFRKNKKPINLHHLYGASRIWHSVVMIGHRPAQTDREEQILIKDSLGELGVGKWVSAENFRQTLYGAITVRDE